MEPKIAEFCRDEVITQKGDKYLITTAYGPAVVTLREGFYDFSQAKPIDSGRRSFWAMRPDSKGEVYYVRQAGNPTYACLMEVRAVPLARYRRSLEDRIRKDHLLCFELVA